MTISNKYRATSLCIIKKEDSILLEQFPEEDGIITYRPVGGTIEYGENSKATVIREIKEEIDQDIVDVRLLGIIENIFFHHGNVGHEFDFIYEATLSDYNAYKQDVIQGIEGKDTFQALWIRVSDFTGIPKMNLVPAGLYEMLTNTDKSVCINHIKHLSPNKI